LRTFPPWSFRPAEGRCRGTFERGLSTSGRWPCACKESVGRPLLRRAWSGHSRRTNSPAVVMEEVERDRAQEISGASCRRVSNTRCGRRSQVGPSSAEWSIANAREISPWASSLRIEMGLDPLRKISIVRVLDGGHTIRGSRLHLTHIETRLTLGAGNFPPRVESELWDAAVCNLMACWPEKRKLVSSWRQGRPKNRRVCEKPQSVLHIS
jgi:hypothetical protein